VFLRTLANQFLHDLKVNWQKSVLLGVLFTIDLYFWIPPLYRAVAGRKPAPSIATTPATAHSPVVAVQSPVAGGKQIPRPSLTTPKRSDSTELKRSDAGERCRVDPLAHSVVPSAIRTDPFRIDTDQFPPPVVFAKEPKAVKPKQSVPVASTPVGLPAGLVLRSTILGDQRRAAFINRRLYFPGMDVQFDGAVYKLIAVHPRRVVLRRGSDEFDLTIRKQSSSGKTGSQRSFVQPAGESGPVRQRGL